MNATLSGDAVLAVADYADSWLGFRQRLLRLPGLQAAITVAGEPVREIVHGHADVERGVAMTPRHLFRVASHSKTFTGVAVLQLVEQGRLRLDDRAADHLDWLADGPLATVTVADLLSHAGGLLRDGEHADWWQLSYPFPDAGGLRALVAGEPDRLPVGERFKYSNVGFGLLGAVIEAVTGRTYADVLEAGVIRRLGLVDTSTEYWPERAGDYAVGYTALAYCDERRPIDHVDTRALAAATGFTSNATELSRYFCAHTLGDDTLLGDESKRRMQHPAWPIPADPGEKPDHYGLGIWVSEVDDVTLVGHGGGYPGHITRSLVDPRSGVALSVLVNCIDAPSSGLARAVVRMIAAAGKPPSDDQRVAPGDAERFTGRFAELWGVTDVVYLGGRLLLLDPTADDPLAAPEVAVPESGNTLRVVEANGSAGYREPMRYTFDPDGSVRSISGPSGGTQYPIDVLAGFVNTRPRVTAGTIPGES